MSRKSRAKAKFCKTHLSSLNRALGFVDVGSGGPLKHPWSLLPSRRVHKYDIDPEAAGGEQPVCISNLSGKGKFHVAVDPRASSLHMPSPTFIDRFGSSGMLTAKMIDVDLRTLSEIFGQLEDDVDMLDVNVEGHDAQVLRGAETVFQRNFIKLVKVEYELAEAWLGQGWFGDIDDIMRGRGYDLADMMNERAKPAIAADLRARGEPIWGKAIYVKSPASWSEHAKLATPEQFARDCLIGICIYTIFDLPARALEVANIAKRAAPSGSDYCPTPDQLYETMVEIFGRVRGRTIGRRLAAILPLALRERLRPIALRLIGA